ncbi:MAG: hypothetical protein QNJ72_05700 [Pleurocapsa sp. MO_226.B13]|nr:hypothetical protein [Pleurocapsa sp. MO_226.B13]
MAEGNSTNNTQAKETKPKTSTTKTATDTKAKATAMKEDKSLALSVQSKTLLPQNRPIEPSSLEIVHTYSSVGSDRPVSKGTVQFNSSIVVSGNRPIAASTLKISDSYAVMGNRPVASNESDDTATLMGYID